MRHLSIHWWKHEARSRADHVTELLNPESSYSRSPVSTSSRKSYLFHSLNLKACSLHLIEWDRIDTVERWIDTDQSLHLDRSEDDKTICEERALIDNLFFWISSIISIRDEIRDHLPRFFSYIWLRFLPLSVYSRCLKSESELNSSDLFFWTSFQLNSCRSAVRAIFDSCKPSNPCKIASQSEQSSFSQAVKPLQWRQILNHKIDQKNDES
jgi:hypothetical protein